jgi:transposase-like protein
MWVAPTESASFWMRVLTDLKARGVEDILIASTDNLTGFTDAIQVRFPVFQECVGHPICLAVNKPDSFQTPAFKECVSKH